MRALMDGFKNRVSQLGQVMELERTQEQFKAILLPVTAVDPRLELSDDPRELATIEARRDRVPEIKYGDVILQLKPFWALPGEDVPSPRWRAIRRDDNPANFAVKWWLVKITDQDAQD
jgi:hypothetical protein